MENNMNSNNISESMGNISCLKPGTCLNNRYVIKNWIADGGFGILYEGFDNLLEMKVAIKEYFPANHAARNSSGEVTAISEEKKENFKRGAECFLNEAKSIAKFDNMPGIVSVKDFFTANGTAYIVMEFIEGMSFKKYLNICGGRLPADMVIAMMKPLILSLRSVHDGNIIHRDISPDNIMIDANNEVKLIDFGAARNVSVDGNGSTVIQLRPGYAPPEQYHKNTLQGPWTDVYALCATIYRAITGVKPIESVKRTPEDTLVRPSLYNIPISPALETAIMHGLAINPNERIQNMQQLYDAFYGGEVNTVGGGAAVNTVGGFGTENAVPVKKNNLLPVLIIVMSVVAALAVGITIFGIVSSRSGGVDIVGNDDVTPVYTPISTSSPTNPPAPSFPNVSASSTRGADYTAGYANYYYVSYICDGDYTTAWTCNRNVELTPSITFTAPTKQHVSGIKMANGYFKSEQTYTRNRRISKVMVTYEGGSKTVDLNINSYRIMQDIPFDTPADTSYVAVKVLDTVYGDWKDVAISEIEIY